MLCATTVLTEVYTTVEILGSGSAVLAMGPLVDRGRFRCLIWDGINLKFKVLIRVIA